MNFNQINDINYDELTGIQKETLSWLSKEIKDFGKNRISFGHTFENTCFIEDMYKFDFVNPIRQLNGGQVCRKISTNPLLNHLLEIGREYYIVYLMSVRDKFSMPRLSLSRTKMEKWVELIRNDPILSKKFKGINNISFMTPNIKTSSISYNLSSGTSFSSSLFSYLHCLCEQLLTHAFEITFYRGNLTLEAFYLSIEDSYKCFINFLQTEEINTFAYFGLNGISTNSKISVSDDLTIYPIDEEHHQRFRKLDLSPKRRDYKGTEYFTGSILEMRIKVKNCPSDDDRKEESQQLQRKMDILFRKVTLSTILFANDDNICPRMSWSSVLNLITSSGMSWPSQRVPRDDKFLKIYSDEERSRFIVLFDKIKDIELTSIEVAIDRFISALKNKDDPVDKFIDIMIALENLFGPCEEISKKLPKAIAVFLKNDINDPLAREIKKHYNYRSRIIHGSSRYTFKEINKFNEFSLEVLKDCLVRLLTDRTDLLPLSSDKRVGKLLCQQTGKLRKFKKVILCKKIKKERPAQKGGITERSD